MFGGQVLFVDNDPDFLDTRAEFLENAGYRVMKAYTLEQARQLLADARVHLIILDIRMVNEDDEKDTSGLTLAKDPAYRPLPKIILTGYPSYKYVREVLGPALEGLPPAVDFLAKDEGPGAMIQAAARAFAQHVRLNWDLHINWDPREHLSFLHLVSPLQPDLPNDTLLQRADELEDLFRRLFYDYQQIRIGRLLWHDQERFCLQVLAQSSQGATDSRILVCGGQGCVERDLKQVRELAPESAQGTKLDSTAETMHFAAAAFTLLGAELEIVQPLRDLFQHAQERPLRTAFDHLLKDVLLAWHQRGQMVEQRRDLMTLYRLQVGLEENGFPHAEVERRVEALIQMVRPLSAVEIERGDGVVTFHFPNQPPLVCPDPVAAAYAHLASYDKPIVCKVSPGQLTADNVLVDAKQRVWLTDFRHSGQVPQWWNFVCLEAMVRFDLSQAPDLLAWQEFEECLVTPTQLHDRLQIQDVISDLRSNLVLIEQIRRQAGSEAGPDPLPYYAGLLIWTVGAIADHDPSVLYTQAERMRGAQLLLAAAVLTQRLGKTFSAHQAGQRLRLEGDGAVWIGDRCVGELGGQELELLRCLYERTNQPVTREVIVKSAFKEPYRIGDDQMESRINSLVRRLRVKIEPDPNRPRYVVTVRGKGLRLETEGK